MKSMIRFTMLAMLLVFVSNIGEAQKKENKKQKKTDEYTAVIEKLDQGYFEFVPQRAFPQGWKAVDLTSNYGFLRVNDTNAVADMPFFGRGYQPQYGGDDGGIKFDGEMVNLKVEKNDKKWKILYSFEVKGQRDNFKVTVDMSYSGYATVSVISNNKSTISYYGLISFEKPKSDK